MKFVKYTLLSLLALVVIAIIAAWVYLEPLVKGVVHKVGTQVVGTEVTLDGFKLHPIDGELEITGLKVANPQGYKEPNLLSLGGVFVKVNVKSLYTDNIVVENIRVTAPEITYEMPNYTTSNIQQIQENVARNTASNKNKKPVKEETAETKTAPAKNVVIRNVLVEDGKLSALTPLQKNGEALVLDLPAVEITGIGDGRKNMTIDESLTIVFNRILFNATSVATKALGNVSDAAKKLADEAAKQAEGRVREEAEGLLNKVKFW